MIEERDGREAQAVQNKTTKRRDTIRSFQRAVFPLSVLIPFTVALICGFIAYVRYEIQLWGWYSYVRHRFFPLSAEPPKAAFCKCEYYRQYGNDKSRGHHDRLSYWWRMSCCGYEDRLNARSLGDLISDVGKACSEHIYWILLIIACCTALFYFAKYILKIKPWKKQARESTAGVQQVNRKVVRKGGRGHRLGIGNYGDHGLLLHVPHDFNAVELFNTRLRDWDGIKESIEGLQSGSIAEIEAMEQIQTRDEAAPTVTNSRSPHTLPEGGTTFPAPTTSAWGDQPADPIKGETLRILDLAQPTTFETALARIDELEIALKTLDADRDKGMYFYDSLCDDHIKLQDESRHWEIMEEILNKKLQETEAQVKRQNAWIADRVEKGRASKRAFEARAALKGRAGPGRASMGRAGKIREAVSGPTSQAATASATIPQDKVATATTAERSVTKSGMRIVRIPTIGAPITRVEIPWTPPRINVPRSSARRAEGTGSTVKSSSSPTVAVTTASRWPGSATTSRSASPSSLTSPPQSYSVVTRPPREVQGKEETRGPIVL